MSRLPEPCLMLVTEPVPLLIEIVAAAIEGGVNMVQWREKRAAGAGYFHTYAGLCVVTPEAVPLVVNGNWESAVKRGARAIHLPEQSVPIGVVRHRLGPRALIGKSVHSAQGAEQAARQGADYLFAGLVFAETSQPDITPTGLEGLREVCEAVSVPVLAFGGVTPDNAGACIAAGAAGVAVSAGIMRAADVHAAARLYRAALNAAWANGHGNAAL